MAVIRVSSQAQLGAAVKNVRSGDTIALSSGTYEGFTTSKWAFAQKVTITSADPRNPATLNEFHLRNASNVEFKGLRFDYNPSKSGDVPFWIEGSRNVSVVNVDIDGHIGGSGYGVGVGFRIKNSSNVTLIDSEIEDFRNGLFASNSTNVNIVNNDIQGMSNDGMLLGGMTDVLIAGNHFHDMKSPPAMRHKDSIQFMTGSEYAPSKDVVIRDNLIETPQVTHGIFLTNTLYVNGNGGAYYRNILIEDNVVRSNHVHGISVYHGDGVTIRNNVVEQIPGAMAGGHIPLINVSRYSRDVLIQGNKAESVPAPQNGTWTVIGNDTGSKRQHWDGGVLSTASKLAAPAISDAVAEDAGMGATGVGQGIDGDRVGRGETFRIGGRMLDEGGTTRFLVGDLDFSDRDVFVFSNFDRGTFRHERGGNPVSVWNDGASFKANAMADFHEIADASPQVTATVRGEQLILEIERGDGVAEVVFAGLGDAFRAADPDLF